MDIFEMAIARALAGGGNTGGGGGGASGGLSIKTITFTDRPSLYAWLCGNHDKVLKATLSTNQSPLPVNYSTLTFSYQEDSESYWFEFSHLTSQVSGENNMYIGGPWLRVTATNVEATMGSKGVRFENDTFTHIGTAPQTIPDGYWSAMENEVTIYYIA